MIDEKQVADYMDSAKQGSLIGVKQLIDEHGMAAIPQLYPYLDSREQWIKTAAAWGIGYAMQDVQDRKQRQQVVLNLLPHASPEVFAILKQTKPPDFGQPAREHVRAKLHGLWPEQQDAKLVFYILVSGIAGMTDEIVFLKEIVEASTEKLEDRVPRGQLGSAGWAALKASARMGANDHVQRVLALLQKIQPEWRRALKFDELIYVRQPEVVCYLWEYLKRDDGPEPAGIDAIQRSYATIAADTLAEILKDFPKYTYYTVVDDNGNATDYVREIQELRRWMSEQKEWHFK